MARRVNNLLVLTVLAAALPAAEAAMIAGVGFQAARGLPSQASAVWPYDSYHDLRWLLVYHRSILEFVLAYLVVAAVRGALTAVLIYFSWPERFGRPSVANLFRRNLVVALLVMAVIMPWATISIAFSVVSLSWLLIASLLPMIVISPFLLRAAVAQEWWRGLPTLAQYGWTTLNVVVITAAGAIMTAVPAWWSLPVAALAGAGNGLLWRRSVAVALEPVNPRWRRLPVAPVVGVLVLITPTTLLNVPGILDGPAWRPPILEQPLPEDVPQAVIVIAGHDSEYRGEPSADPRVERYSYEGLDSKEAPLPYRPEATHQSLDVSAVRLASHVDSLHRRTRLPIALVGQSEGALVARTYLEKWPASPVTDAVLLSPLVMPGRAYYTPPHTTEGWGVVTGYAMRAVFQLWFLGDEARGHPDEPFVRSIIIDAPFYRNRILCPVAGIRVIAFLPTVSAIEAPPGEFTQVPTVQSPAFHAGLFGSQDIHQLIINFLQGEEIQGRRREYAILQHLGAAWQPPPLALSLNPIWSASIEGDPAFSGKVCQERN